MAFLKYRRVGVVRNNDRVGYGNQGLIQDNVDDNIKDNIKDKDTNNNNNEQNTIITPSTITNDNNNTNISKKAITNQGENVVRALRSTVSRSSSRLMVR